MQQHCLVAICEGPDLPPAIKERAHACTDALRGSNPGWTVHVARHTTRAPNRPQPGPLWAAVHARNMAWLRNDLLAAHLANWHTHVLWLDADLVAFPPDLICRLHAACPDGVAAPLPVIERTRRLYDTYCLLDRQQQPADAEPPYMADAWNTIGRTIPIWSAGCCYLLPAAVHRQGGVFTPTIERPGEHRGVFTQVAAMGLACVLDMETIIEHADLPRYGLAWH
jgi:hypothetical protein